MMTRKDYVLIAQVLKTGYEQQMNARDLARLMIRKLNNTQQNFNEQKFKDYVEGDFDKTI
jgi:hypothetical protein